MHDDELDYVEVCAMMIILGFWELDDDHVKVCAGSENAPAALKWPPLPFMCSASHFLTISIIVGIIISIIFVIILVVIILVVIIVVIIDVTIINIRFLLP